MKAKELLFFPRCAMDGMGSEFGHSTVAVLAALGRPIRILEDWNCCGASAARDVDRELSVRLSARNLALAADRDCDVMVNCAACYNNLAFSRNFLEDHPEAWPASLETASAARPESAEVHHLLTILAGQDMQNRLAEKVVHPLAEMRLACYYGCLLVRPQQYARVDDAEDPCLMEELMGICGAQSIDWSYKTDCCGGSFALIDKPISVDLVARIFQDALAQDVTGLVTACPLCHMNLDAWQRNVSEKIGRTVHLPIYYFTELLALAMDLPGVRKWLGSHLTDARQDVRKCR